MAVDTYKEPVFRIAGDRGILMEFGDGIAPQIHERIRAMTVALDQTQVDGLIEYIPTYRSVAVLYDPLRTSFARLKIHLLELHENLGAITVPAPGIIELPVCYGGDFGPDLAHVALHHNLSAQEVIRLHSDPGYLVYMIGFTPGFPFLGGLPERLHTPRLDTPRKKVPAGSVGIANGQTGVYPIESPGGWQLIGRTPVKLFDLKREAPFLLRTGDILKFKPIDEREFLDLSGDAQMEQATGSSGP